MTVEEPEYVDGEIVERHLGTLQHSKGQMRVISFFSRLSDRHSVHPFPGLTLRVSTTRCRVPDMSVYFGSEPEEDFPSIPPDVVVEIVSEEDRFSQVLERLAEFHEWGVRHIWIADSGTRRLAIYDSAGLHEVPSFELPEFGVTLSRD